MHIRVFWHLRGAIQLAKSATLLDLYMFIVWKQVCTCIVRTCELKSCMKEQTHSERGSDNRAALVMWHLWGASRVTVDTLLVSISVY